MMRNYAFTIYSDIGKRFMINACWMILLSVFAPIIL